VNVVNLQNPSFLSLLIFRRWQARGSSWLSAIHTAAYQTTVGRRTSFFEEFLSFKSQHGLEFLYAEVILSVLVLFIPFHAMNNKMFELAVSLRPFKDIFFDSFSAKQSRYLTENCSVNSSLSQKWNRIGRGKISA
jgi:hypothetical protein